MIRFIALPAMFLATAAIAEPQKFELDPAHTTVAFTIDHVGYAKTLGQFSDVSGSFTYDADTQELSDVSVTIQTDSINTLHEERDKHVRSGDFLGTADHPEMVFTAATGEAIDETNGTVTGELTLLGETQPLTLDVTLNKADTYPFGHKKFVMGISARGSLKRSEFGMSYGVENGLVGDEVALIIETEGMAAE